MIRLIIRVALLSYIGLGIALVVFERHFVYYPDIVPSSAFGECVELADATSVTHHDARFYYGAHAGDRVVVWYPGNAGSVCDRAAFADVFARAGYAYLLVEHPGYGEDDAGPSRARLLAQSASIRDFIESEGYRDVVLAGESIGVGIAAYHAAAAQPNRMIFVSPYYELADMAGWLGRIYPVRALMRENYVPGEWLQDVAVPMLFIRAAEDEIIPRESAMRLYESVSGEKTLYEISGATHNSLYGYPELYERIEAFLRMPNDTSEEVVQ